MFTASRLVQANAVIVNHVLGRHSCWRSTTLLERRDGRWRIAVRRSTVEVMFLADASVLQSSFFKDTGYPVGTRDRSDLSYQRPLSIDTPAPKRW